MFPFFGKTVSALLCVLILLGQPAAWLHVATCSGHSHAVVAEGCGSAAEPVHAHSACGHHHHDHGDSAGSVPSDAEPDGGRHVRGHSHDSDSPHDSGHPHDSDRCATCQSLASAKGVAPNLSVAVNRVAPIETIGVVDIDGPHSISIGLPHLRGPPAV